VTQLRATAELWRPILELEETTMVNDSEMQYFRRCVKLATEALEAGDEPFGSVLVAADGTFLFEDRNRVGSGDRTRHPEFEIARWAAANMPPQRPERQQPFTPRVNIAPCVPQHTGGSAWVESCM
jgi:tRNA(Arg) A34 adenosine deaminase TadA